MKKIKLSILSVAVALMSLTGASLLLGPGCGSRSGIGEQQGSTADTQMAPNVPGAPAKALFGQYYKDPKTNRIWIYDGANWVPHDSTVDTYYQQLAATKNSTVLKSMTIDEVKTAPCTSADATGAHAKHSGFDCKVCHMVGGVMCFDPAGPATAPTGTPPSFDTTTKTCSNVKCHGVAAGTFSYYYPGNETDADGYPIPELKTVNYGGTMAAGTPSWYATGVGCSACHGNPPANGSDGSNAWHSSHHANDLNVGSIGPNACELCHNDPTKYPTWVPVAFSAVGADGLVHGYQINSAAAAQHANGTATVLAKFVSQCFGCH